MLHARDTGQGQAVVLLHAFPLNSRMWEPQVEALRRRARLVVPDFPGFGLSGAPTATPTLEQYAQGVVSVLGEKRIENVVVVGLSMGAYVAFQLVNLLGSRLYGLLLADARPTADSQAAVSERHELAAEVEAQGVEAAANEFLPKLLGSTTMRTQPGLIDRVRAIIMENTAVGVAGALRALAARPDVTGMLGRIRCPVSCVVGEEDAITTPDVVRAMTSRIANARVEVLPNAGHLSNLENPEAFNDALVALLAMSGPA